MEDVLTTLPLPAFRNGNAACVACTIAIMSIAMDAAQPASSSVPPKPDALFTSTSIPPSAAAAALT